MVTSDLSEKAMAPHSSTLACKIPWTEEPGRLQSMGSLRVGHNWATSFSLFTFHALEKEMATHSSVLAWRIPGTVEPDGLPSMGSHRVEHDWSNLAVTVATVIFRKLLPKNNNNKFVIVLAAWNFLNNFHYLGYMNVGIIGEILIPPLIKLQFFDAHHSY